MAAVELTCTSSFTWVRKAAFTTLAVPLRFTRSSLRVSPGLKLTSAAAWNTRPHRPSLPPGR